MSQYHPRRRFVRFDLDTPERIWSANAHRATEALRVARLDKPLGQLADFPGTARRKVAEHLRREVPPDAPAVATPQQLEARAKRAREQRVIIAAIVALVVITEWLRRKATSAASGQ